jgi:Ca-activated chloride channel family protein
VSSEQREAAAVFQEYISATENQRRVLEFGIRPGNPDVPLAAPIDISNGVDPDQPQALLEVPAPAVVDGLIDRWDDQRKKARVLLVLDISGSMEEFADPSDPSLGTKLDLAKQAAVDALDLFSPDDEVALRVFSTNLGDNEDQFFLDLVPYGRVGDIRESVRNRILDLFPTNGTPLYDVTLASYEDALESYDPDRINAVVLLTDGHNDDGDDNDDEDQFLNLINELRAGTEGENATPIRIFPIGYGGDADLDALRSVAEATSANVYDASDPASITKVLIAVISNF